MLRTKPLPVREVLGEDHGEPGVWPYTMAPVRQLLTEGFELAALTVLVGENGAGKSTVLEAIALALGLGAEGGSTGSRTSTRVSESNLHEHIRLAQVLVATRSPVVAAAPGARLLQRDEAGYRKVSWEALESGQLHRRFLAGPSALLDAL